MLVLIEPCALYPALTKLMPKKNYLLLQKNPVAVLKADKTLIYTQLNLVFAQWPGMVVLDVSY